MTVEEIKTKMLKWIDFYGGDLLYVDEIKSAKTKQELEQILERHRDFMEGMLLDACSHLDRFKESLGLDAMQIES